LPPGGHFVVKQIDEMWELHVNSFATNVENLRPDSRRSAEIGNNRSASHHSSDDCDIAPAYNLRALADPSVGRMRRRKFIGSLIGTAVAWPLAASAQQPAKVYRIAIVQPSRPVKEMNETSSIYYRAFFGKLRRLGYVEGQNLIVERYSGEGRTAHYAELASEVVRQQPDVILASSNRIVREFKADTATIPIAALMTYPVAFGLVSSLARPGGNEGAHASEWYFGKSRRDGLRNAYSEPQQRRHRNRL
jgi:hypothetical protein